MTTLASHFEMSRNNREELARGTTRVVNTLEAVRATITSPATKPTIRTPSPMSASARRHGDVGGDRPGKARVSPVSPALERSKPKAWRSWAVTA